MVAILKNFMKERWRISEERLTICRKCEHFDSENENRCKKCGCYMDYKTLLKDAECPIGLWKKWTEDVDTPAE